MFLYYANLENNDVMGVAAVMVTIVTTIVPSHLLQSLSVKKQISSFSTSKKRTEGPAWN